MADQSVQGSAGTAPKAGVPAPPPLELIASLQATLDGGQAKAQWAVDGRPGDNGDYEYFAVVRVPDVDLVSNISGQKALAVSLKPDVHVIATQINAIGGAPLAGTRVQLVDPETGTPEGDPVRSDEKGRVVATVSENKPYNVKILDDDGDILTPGPQENPPIEAQAEAWLVAVRVVDAGGRPRAGAAFKLVNAAAGVDASGTTDAEGDVQMPAGGPGAFDLEIGGGKFKVPAIQGRDLAADPSPYRLVVP